MLTCMLNLSNVEITERAELSCARLLAHILLEINILRAALK